MMSTIVRAARPVSAVVARMIAASIVSSLAASPAKAQEDLDRLSALGMRPSLSLSDALAAEKRRAVREGEWVFSLMGAGQAGYDSNVCLSPHEARGRTDLEIDSFFLDSAAEVRVQKNFTPDHQLRASAQIHNTYFREESDANTLDEDVSLDYTAVIAPGFEFWISPDVTHTNDNATNIFGEHYRRSFENFTYEFESGFSYDFVEGQQIALSYSGERKDYRETRGMESLDWWLHGPGVKYKLRLADSLLLRAWYEFLVQTYDEDRASLENGRELPTNPTEKHFFHRALLWLNYEFADGWLLFAKYRLRIKDDRFQGYESYTEHAPELGLKGQITKRLSVSASGDVAFRDFKHRPGKNALDTLEYTKYGANVELQYQLTENLAVFSAYNLAVRESNRPVTSTTYRSYEAHIVSLGLRVGF